MDFPRDRIVEMAKRAIQTYGGSEHARVYFKFTCPKCRARCTFVEPNKLHERGACFECGHEAPVSFAGFKLELGAP